MALMRASGNVSPKANAQGAGRGGNPDPDLAQAPRRSGTLRTIVGLQLSFEFAHLLSDRVLPGGRYSGDAEKRARG